MIFKKFYIYDSTKTDYKGTDYSAFVLQGNSDTDNLDDTINECEITLQGLPFRTEISPSTKVIIDTVEDGTIIDTKHWQVNNDTVSQPIMSDDEYFTHSLTLNEPAIVAQQRVCDNFSITYKLQDVTLNVAPTYDTESKMRYSVLDADSSAGKYNFGLVGTSLGKEQTYTAGHKFKWVMPNWYDVQVYNETKQGGTIIRTLVTKKPSWEDWNNIKYNCEIPTGSTTKEIRLPVPMLELYGGVNGTKTYSKICCVPIEVVVKKKKNGVETGVTALTVYPDDNDNNEKWSRSEEITDANGNNSYTLNEGWIVSRCIFDVYRSNNAFTYHFSNVYGSLSTKTNRVIVFNAEAGYEYTVNIKRKVFAIKFPYDLPSTYNAPYTDDYPYLFYSSWHSAFILGQGWEKQDTAGAKTNDTVPSIGQTAESPSFLALQQGDNVSKVFGSAPPVSALQLFNKALITTADFRKKEGIPIADMMKKTSPSPFYLETEDYQELENTQVVEAFYNQKNFWEICVEVGKYIHARPVIQFGDDDKFKVTWKRYGKGEISETPSTIQSVYNSRFVDEYISSVTSYVNNIIQLGGTITEIIPCQSGDESYTVSNDNVAIKTRYPITEIVEMYAKRYDETTWHTLTGTKSDTYNDGTLGSGFIFEKNVYNVLPITYTTNVNKGMAIYYELGDNVIQGCTYQLPVDNQIWSSAYKYNDYTLKKVLYRACVSETGDDWANLKCNDYVFKIVYRTKDNVRIDQSRPDIRKYLLNSKYDDIPQHYQFNNQEDLMVDSLKFGNNVYGKLIRTGNTIYTQNEWVTTPAKLKKAGELYNIYNNLYYVSKVKNTYYTDHIVSEVEYSKDFNRLSQIVGIPSEPRFYEISEQSAINREVRSHLNLLIKERPVGYTYTPSPSSVVASSTGLTLIRNILFGNASYPQYVNVTTKSETDSKSNLYENFLLPITAYSVNNTLLLSWQMVDNFSAGDQMSTAIYQTDLGTNDSAYRSVLPYCYTDTYGRVDLYEFAVVSDPWATASVSQSNILGLPKSPLSEEHIYAKALFRTFDSSSQMQNGSHGIVLQKDNREVLAWNLNIEAFSGSDRIVTSSYMWQQNKGSVYVVLGKEEVSKINNGVVQDTMLKRDTNGDVVRTPLQIVEGSNYVYINIQMIYNNLLTLYGADIFDGVKSLIIASDSPVSSAGTARYFVIAYNASANLFPQRLYLQYVPEGYFTKQ